MLKLVLVSLAVLMLIACDKRTEQAAVTAVDGKSCTVSSEIVEGDDIGSRVTCDDNTTSLVLHGEQGIQGEQGVQGIPGESGLVDAIGISGYIFPCGNEFNNDEIFLRLTDNNILALYDGGPHEDRLVLLAPGNYITTDRNKAKTCHFTVTPDLQITNERVK